MVPGSRLRCLVVCAVVVWACGIAPAFARATDVPFAFLIKNGYKNLYAGQAARLDQGLVSWYGFGALHAIANGQKAGVLGTAFIQAYSRSVPDPSFSAMAPLAALITLDFGTFQAHLSLFDTPSGPRTTVSALTSGGASDTGVSGVWVLGDGAAIGGGTPDDMVIGALVHFSQPTALHNIQVVVPPYFPLVSFANDPTFTRVSGPSVVGLARCLGSGYGRAQGPLRVYNRCDDYGLGAEFSGTLMVMHTAGDNYAVMACSRLGTSTTGWAVLDPLGARCTLAGSGSILSRMSGPLNGFTINQTQSRVMQWALFFAP